MIAGSFSVHDVYYKQGEKLYVERCRFVEENRYYSILWAKRVYSHSDFMYYSVQVGEDYFDVLEDGHENDICNALSLMNGHAIYRAADEAVRLFEPKQLKDDVKVLRVEDER